MADHAFKIAQPEKPYVNALVGLMDLPVPTVVGFLLQKPSTCKDSRGVYADSDSITHVKRVWSTLCRKSCAFSGYSGFLPQGKLTGD